MTPFAALPKDARAIDPALAGEARCRIALVISALHLGGAERVVCKLAEFWRRSGHPVTVITLATRDDDVYALPPGVDRLALGLARPSRHVAEALARGVQRVLTLRQAVQKTRAQVVVSFLEATNVLSLLAMTGTDIPVIACVRTDPRAARLGRPWALMRRLLYPRARGVVVQTERVAGWARKFCPRVHVIPNSVDTPPRFATPEVDAGPKRLIAMGRLSREKGFDLLMEAFARLAGAFPDWSLVILGDGPELARLEALASRLGLEGRVALPGRVAEPLPLLATGHAFALPSLHEGFPNALLEAMATGLPVVAFDCPSGPSEIIDHDRNGLLVRTGDVRALGAALERIMSDPAVRARLGGRAREVAGRFAPERVLPLWSLLLPGPGRTSSRAARA